MANFLVIAKRASSNFLSWHKKEWILFVLRSFFRNFGYAELI